MIPLGAPGGSRGPPGERPATTAATPKAKTAPRNSRGVLFDTAAGASCIPEKTASGRKPIDGVQGPALETANGQAVKSAGKVYEAPIHTGKKVLPARAVAADVVQPIISAFDYCGPGEDAGGKDDGEFEAVVRPRKPELRHIPTGETFPLRWEDRTLKLAEATGAIEDAQRLTARLARLVRGRYGSRAVRIPSTTAASPSSGSSGPRPARGGHTTAKREETKQAAHARIAALGSAAFRLSRRHLLTLARDMGLRAAECRDASKKQLFRLVAAKIPDGGGEGLRPGRPGRELL